MLREMLCLSTYGKRQQERTLAKEEILSYIFQYFVIHVKGFQHTGNLVATLNIKQYWENLF